ncbi:MAG: hypothetical protein DRP63_04275, partial [Planctomycetota bacterium]
GRAFYFGSGETKDSAIENFTIKNGSPDYGAAIFCWSSSPTIQNCAFSGNSADCGGAIGCDNSSPRITNCTFSGNSADDYGGAIFCWSSSPTIQNCAFSGNIAHGWGGAIFCHSSSPTITNCTFSGNIADDCGGAIFCCNSSSPTLNNSILWSNTASSSGNEIYISDSGSSCTLNYCCVAHGAGDYGGGGTIDDSNNCIHSDPKIACVEAGMLRLKHDSPCIDAGDNSLVPASVTTDIMGCQRIVGSAVDIGAYEVQGIIYVDGVGGDDANTGVDWGNALKTIGAGLNAADDGWIVVVADATYNETDFDFNGKKIYLKGVDYYSGGLTRPVIDCGGGGRAFYFGSGETADSVIHNFIIRNGKVEDAGGGAILCENNSSPTIKNCVFENNKAVDTNGSWDYERGGAIYCSSSSPTITNCTFSGNRADYGGAIYCYSSSPTITNCTFSGNKGYGGAIYCYSSSPSVTNCTFSGNSAEYGGAIYCRTSSPTITNCTFSGNSASDDGGAICCNQSSPTITNCTFSGNSASDDGGALRCYSSRPTLNNCILWGNSAVGAGDEIYVANIRSLVKLNYCCVDNTGYGGYPARIRENNCIHDDPQFVDPANSDYHLKDTSPCIDAGDNSLVPSGVDEDLDGNERIVDGDNDGTATVDIGAYEKQP